MKIPSSYHCLHYLDIKCGEFFWHVNVVPDADALPILGYHHITLWDPLYIGAVVE